MTDADAYTVYDAIVPSDWLIQTAHATELLIQDMTEGDNRFMKQCAPTGPGLTAPWQEALSDFNNENASAKSLTAQFSLPVPYRLESKDAIRAFFTSAGPSGWGEFHNACPNTKGYLQLSAVGFDKARDHAIVYMAHWCGGLCGEAAYHFVSAQAMAGGKSVST